MKVNISDDNDSVIDEEQMDFDELELSAKEKEEFDIEQTELESFRPLVDAMAAVSPNDHPDVYDVRTWKHNYGKIYLSTIVDDTDLYVWRPILRLEWKELIGKDIQDPFERAEALCRKCLLFPRVETVLYKKPAGVLPALETKIMFQSGFVNEQMLINSISEIA